jgi:hypothetical protein
MSWWTKWRARVAAEPLEPISIGQALTAFGMQLRVVLGAYKARHDYRQCGCGIWVHKTRPPCGAEVKCVWA